MASEALPTRCSGIGPERPYNRAVEEPLAFDTPLEIERLQIAAWRGMTAAEKAAIVTSLTQAAFAMTQAGVRHRHPDASTREQFLRVAIITLGAKLACAAYPDARPLLTAP